MDIALVSEREPNLMRGKAAAELLRVLRARLPVDSGPYALHEAEFDALDHTRVDEALTEGYISFAGRHVGLFEEAPAAQCGTRRAVDMVSGTMAIQMMLTAAGVGQEDEVLCPALTFAGDGVGALANWDEVGELRAERDDQANKRIEANIRADREPAVR